MAYTLDGPAAMTDFVSPMQAAKHVGASIKTIEWWLENHTHWRGSPDPRKAIRIAEWSYQSANSRHPNGKRSPLIALSDLHAWALNTQSAHDMKPYTVDFNV